ncbi:conserved hypothetical protein [Pantoea brenneri]|uniref:Phage protein n=1 Tax=Pantoea brenneri TaxID=472694 RepID=A0AAX3J417_9GAMM|nr:hypothetical protein [Pantoea brenneri]VXB52128.1 conserved hypothetical protein [Pantoea brenneri]
MKVVNMKTGTESVEGENGAVETRDEYPWGLRISLNGDALKKLGTELPKVGDMMAIGGMAKIVGVSTRESEGGESHSHIDLQITDFGMEASDATPPKTAAATLYGPEDD